MGVRLDAVGRADLAAFFPQAPVGVPAKTPLTVVPVSRPTRPRVI